MNKIKLVLNRIFSLTSFVRIYSPFATVACTMICILFVRECLTVSIGGLPIMVLCTILAAAGSGTFGYTSFAPSSILEEEDE